jgi:hypothetical protein
MCIFIIFNTLYFLYSDYIFFTQISQTLHFLFNCRNITFSIVSCYKHYIFFTQISQTLHFLYSDYSDVTNVTFSLLNYQKHYIYIYFTKSYQNSLNLWLVRYFSWKSLKIFLDRIYETWFLRYFYFIVEKDIYLFTVIKFSSSRNFILLGTNIIKIIIDNFLNYYKFRGEYLFELQKKKKLYKINV